MKYVVANWKMHLLEAQARALAEQITDISIPADVQCVLCPPAIWLSQIMTIGYDNTDISYGMQDCSPYVQGAYTGDISADMIASAGARYVITGHSERRQHHKEGDALIKAKAEQAIEAGLTPIICVGETLEQREAGQAEEVVAHQLSEIKFLDNQRIIIAYEPVWAIGTGKVASTEDIATMHAAIKRLVDAPVLYGGSVKAENAHEIMAVQAVDGALVGGASLKAEQFAAILQAAADI